MSHFIIIILLNIFYLRILSVLYGAQEVQINITKYETVLQSWNKFRSGKTLLQHFYFEKLPRPPVLHSRT